MTLDPENLKECLRVLEALVEDPRGLARIDLDERNRLLAAAGRLSRPDRDFQRLISREWRKQSRQKVRDDDRAKLALTGIRQKRLDPVFVTPPASELDGHVAPLRGLSAGSSAVPDAEPTPNADEIPFVELKEPRSCYLCKVPFTRVHFFYDSMCVACGDLNYGKRQQTADLRGRVALISGARVKIGYQAAILLLRAGARVIVSTRFPRDAAERYAKEADFLEWSDRLVIYGLDLRHTPSVEAFAAHILRTEERLDFVLHNACQTVRRPTGFYSHLMEGERRDVLELSEGARKLVRDYEALRDVPQRPLFGLADETSIQLQRSPTNEPGQALGIKLAAELSQVALAPEDLQTGEHLFPEGQLDQDLQQKDLRSINSWRLTLDQVGTVELLEVQLVNAIAPFVLNARLRPLMAKTPTRDKHIVNVSAMEGQFYRRYKTDKHPHTNMAKAALNMMTRTSAVDYVKDGIHMNSVDTGWVTDEDPAHIAQRKTEESGFHPPLDIVDGAARIVDPIFDGINTGTHVWGLFLKDYRPVAW
jgi:NAD(P)-dependent dehydrogenase (short-subunit alcohol dehydrogenase family)